MDAITYLALAFLLTALVNAAHWMATRTKQPFGRSSRWVHFLTGGCFTALLFLCFADVMAPRALAMIAFAVMCVQNLAAIVRRHIARHASSRYPVPSNTA